MEQHGLNFLELPPDIIEGKPEWEVEKIIKMCLYGHWKKKQYLVRWKDYSPAHDSWVNKEDLHTPELMKNFKNQQSTSIRTTSATDQKIWPYHPQFPQPSLCTPQMELSPFTAALNIRKNLPC